MRESVTTTKEKENDFQVGVVLLKIIVLFLCLIIIIIYAGSGLIYMKMQKEYELVMKEEILRLDSDAVPEIPVLNATDSFPIFVHIPKTGGTSIENALLQQDVKVGKYLDHSQHSYKVAHVHCSRWHIPPVAVVENSFTVVREPFSRLESEFKYCRRIRLDYCQNTNDDLNGYQDWIVNTLEKARKRYNIGDCHLIPQWHYARWVTVKLPFSQLHKAEFWEQIRRYYNLTKITQLHAKETPRHNGSYVDSLSPEVKSMVELHFREDFQFLSQFW
jgi:hypothetical protein